MKGVRPRGSELMPSSCCCGWGAGAKGGGAGGSGLGLGRKREAFTELGAGWV